MTRRDITEPEPGSTSRADDVAGATRPPEKAIIHGQAEANLSALIESTEDYIWSVDLHYGLIAFNKAAQQDYKTGFGTHAAVGMRPEQLLPPEIAANWPPLYERALREGPFRCEYSFVNGHILELSFNPIVVDGKTTGISVFGKDINERKQAEAALRESEERYRAIFEQSAVGIVHTSLEGRFLICNPRFAEIVGYPIEEIPNLTFQQLTEPKYYPETLAIFQQILNGTAGTTSFEKRCIRKDGSFTWVKATVSAQRDAEGRPLHYIALVEDINARKEAEELLFKAGDALRASEERYRTAFQVSLDAANISRLEDGKFIDVNEAFIKYTGYAREEVIGRTVREFNLWVNPEDRKKMTESLRQNSISLNLEAGFRRKDGTTIWGVLSASKIELDGAPCVLTVVRDITEAKAAAERLAEAQNALRSSEEHYRTVFQTSIDAIGITRLEDGVFIDVNQAFCRIHGFERDEVIGRTAFELHLWTNPEERQRLFEAMRENSSYRDLEYMHTRKNGEKYWVSISGARIELDGVPCIITIVRDITEAKTAKERLAAAQEALRTSEERYHTAFMMSLDGINISRLSDGLFIDVNEAFLKNTGYAHEELVGHTPLEVEIWANPDDRKKFIKELLKNSVCLNLEAPFRRKDGSLLWGMLSASVIELDGVPCILTVVRDLSETKKAEERLATSQNALRASEARYSTAFEASPNAVNIFRLDDGMYLEVNQTFLETMGFEREEVIGRTSQELNIWADPSDLQDIVELLRQKQVFRGEIKQRKKNGETFWGLMSASVFEYEGTSCVLSVTQDISDVKAAQDEIRDLSFYDPLTRLPNRRLLLNRLRRSPIATARNRHRRALLFVDLDNFKSLNDTLGHQTGDLLLQEAALRLGSCVRDSDTVARCGGDEFAVMLENLSEVVEEAIAQAQIVGEKILAICGLPYLLIGHECHCPSSVGITVFGDEQESAKDALQRAEIAMFEAKKAGRNTLRFFAPALQAAVSARATMEEDLREAIKTNQFVLYYQPQVERGRLIGAEALLRWKHPRHGLLAPGEFIPLAEESGLILPLGDWVLEAACAQLASWAVRKEASAIALAVNISARQFRQPNFVERVLAALARTGANPLTLKLELTESMLLDNVDDVIAKMTALKSHGLRLSLDDFGTGYSSLAYLKRLPLDELKIDLSFVRDILADAASGAIAQAILTLGKAMGLRVIAEGVETEEQRDFLIRMGCHSFQGFLYSRPLPLEEFQLWLPESAARAAPKPKKVRRSTSKT
jgi:diguanylate cyclase (GGDEF)-like protein/PAS domain S-box-containing protein